ncbi:hypothetical protein B0H19DRAFT_1260378 [Mycena capillaripes]|nr:hypothetical protein B0H19DRAFT_1260378 [Mycena capillaripes]
MHFAAKNYLRIIVSIAALARTIVVYGTPIENTAQAVEEVTARDPMFGGPGRVAEEVKGRMIFAWIPVKEDPEDIE